MKAIIKTGGKQYMVAPGDQLEVELLENKEHKFVPLMIIDGKEAIIKPEATDYQVVAKVLGDFKREKVTSIRFKAKKRVHKRRGHRQPQTKLEIISIQKKTASKDA